MCVICYKPKDVNFPSKKTLRTMFNNNPDGAGIMYADGERVTIIKGLMNFDEFMRAFKKIDARIDLPVILHFRIATHGGINAGMTQPFPLTAKTKKLKSLTTSCDVGVAHNGIIPMTYDARDISDTALFIKKYMCRICAAGIDDTALDIVETCIDSKMSILEKNGTCHILGVGWKNDGGVYYSNDSYLPYNRRAKKWKYSTTTTTKSTRASYDEFDWSLCDGYCATCSNYDVCYGVTTGESYTPYKY